MTGDEKLKQKIVLRETHREFLVDVMEYPFQQAGVLYLKLIVYGENPLVPIKFLTVQPQDILYRVHVYTKEEEEELVAASDAAREMQEEYVRNVEAEMRAKAAEQAQPELHDDNGLFG